MPSTFRPVLERTLAHALRYLENLDRQPVGATASLAELRGRLPVLMPTETADAIRVIDELVDITAGGVLGSAGGRFFGWVIGGTLPVALAADWLTSAWDNNAAVFATGPAIAIVEETCGRWLKELLNVPPEASFAMTTGCQMSHTVALAAARQHLLARRGWDVNAQGLFGAPPLRVIASTERHGSIERAARLLGLGRNSLIELPTNEAAQLDANALARALADRRDAATVVVLNAGDLNVGAFDPFGELVPLAHEADAWVHVDGAFGLWMAAAPQRTFLLDGARQADSWATDGHKMLNVPFDVGYAFVRYPEAHRISLSHRAAYLPEAGDARDAMDWTPEWSRRGRAVATFAALRQLGRAGLSEMIERLCAHAGDLVTRIANLPGAELVRGSAANQGLVRFLDTRSHAVDADHDARTDAIIADVQKSGDAFFTGTTWRGRRAMRISVCGWATTKTDVDRAVNAVAQSIRQVALKNQTANGHERPFHGRKPMTS